MSAEFPPFDLYEELGVSPRASVRVIDAAYRAMARDFHPDTTPDPTAAEARMKRINAAHDVLADPGERAGYDAWREAQSARRGTEEPRDGSVSEAPATRVPNQCPRCLKQYRTVAGLQWHRANVEACG